jgi:hypothetical protein
MKKLILSLILILAIFVIGVTVASANTIYLPLAQKEPPTPTPTLTPTPTSTPIPSPQLLPNGDFEQGHVSWNEYSNHGYAIINYMSSLPVPPYDGSWAAWLGGAANDADTLHQTVYVSPERPYLSAWLYISSTDLCGYDVAYFFINNTVIAQTWLCTDNNTNGWVQRVYDLHSMVGQNIDIMIYVGTDATRLSSLYLDHFAWQASSQVADPVPVDASLVDSEAMKSEYIK